jgi:sulfide dehydrogenase [flavocytochrome c] flavoprotein subunit
MLSDSLGASHAVALESLLQRIPGPSELLFDYLAEEVFLRQSPEVRKFLGETALLRRQLEAMKDGGVVVLAVPADPFRCPPGPYERVSMIAHYLKTKKPKSKILILDAKDAFSKQGLFMGGWKALYDGMIEWVPLSKDGKVVKVDPKTRQLECELGAKHKGDVVNIVPPQRATAGCALRTSLSSSAIQLDRTAGS